MNICTFVSDITPPIGEALCDGLCPLVSSIEHPLLAKGVILREGSESWVLCALDWAGVGNDAYELFKRRIAEAADTSPACVAVQSVHQHSAPSIDSNANFLMAGTDVPVSMSSLEFLEKAVDSVAAAVGKAVAGQWRTVTHVGTSWAPVNQVASTRRILQPDRTILARFSQTNDPIMQYAPEGCIDGFLRTVSFYEGNCPIVHMHYYATHPMSYYGDGRVTYDVPGLARERIEKESGIFQVYFTGCGGNVAMGKYNDGTPSTRVALTERLYDAMVNSIGSVKRSPASHIHWESIPLTFQLRGGNAFSEATNIQIINDTNVTAGERIKAAMILAMIERVRSGRLFELSCLSVGPIRILHLPGEPFVEYQLWAEHYFPELFVAIAGYGDCAMCYICTDMAYTDNGGYEQTWSFIDPSEEYLRRKIAEIIKG